MTRPSWGWEIDERRRREAHRRALKRAVLAWALIVAGGIFAALAWIGFMALFVVTLG